MNGTPDIVGVLVADLVGSTVQRLQIGEARFETLHGEFTTASRRIVARHLGTLVKEQGDGFIAAFATASAALGAGVSILQAVAGGNRRRTDDEQLHLRVGLSLGETRWEAGDLTGLVPVEAARLESQASSDTMLCSDLVRTMAGAVGPYQFIDQGLLTLKGFQQPVRAWRVEWQRTTTSEQLGVPEALQIESRLPFVGRRDELARLAACWNGIQAGRGQMVTVSGEPGVGKTRVCSEVARMGLDQGGTVLYGRCDSTVAYPYQPFVEALRRYVLHAPTVELIPSADAAELARLVPELRTRLPGLGEPVAADSDTQRHFLFESMVRWLQFLAQEDPVLLIIDDAHWATAPTLAMLYHVATQLGSSSVLCVATYQPQEAADPFRDALARIHRRLPFESVALGGLSKNDVLQAMRQLLGEEALDPAVAEIGSVVWRASGGNPFFVGQLFASLLDSGSIKQDSEGWTALAGADQIAIPPAVGDVVGQRVRSLDAEAQRVLAAASVAGLTFDPTVLRAVVSMPAEPFASALGRAEAAGLVHGPQEQRYEFSHALVRDVIYRDQTGYLRAQLHEAVAAALELEYQNRQSEHADELAHHYSLAASAEGAARAVWYAAVAAERASDRFAYAETVQHYKHALDALDQARLTDADAVRSRLIVDLGVAQHRAGFPEGAVSLLEGGRLAAAAGDGMLCARAVLAGSRGIFSTTGAMDAERVAAMRSALQLIEEGDSLVRSRLLANLSVELSFTGDHAEQDQLSDEATAMARRLGTPGALVPVLALRLTTLWRVDHVGERLALAEELERLCQEYGRPQPALLAATMGCQAAMEAGDFATADRRLATIDEIAASLRQPLSLGYARLRQSLRAAVHGQLDESERLAREAYDYASATGQPDAKAFWVGQLFLVRFYQGRLADVIDELSEAADEYPGIVAFRAAAAMVAAELDRTEQARRSLDRVLGAGGTGVPDDLNWLITTAFCTQAAARLGETRHCEHLLQQLLPYRDLFVDNASTFWGSVERYIGMALAALGRDDDADQAFERAAEAHGRINAPILLADTCLERGRSILRSDPDASARRLAAEQFQKVLAVAEPLELALLAERARTGLAEAL